MDLAEDEKEMGERDRGERSWSLCLSLPAVYQCSYRYLPAPVFPLINHKPAAGLFLETD